MVRLLMAADATAYINRIATAVPPNDIHEPFVHFARTLLTESREQPVFDRMAAKSHIQHRFSVLGAVARVWPGVMSTVALHTRVSDAALARSFSLRTS